MKKDGASTSSARTVFWGVVPVAMLEPGANLVRPKIILDRSLDVEREARSRLRPLDESTLSTLATASVLVVFNESQEILEKDLDLFETVLAQNFRTVMASRQPMIAESASVIFDGRWLAYASNETGRYEVWLEPFPRTGVRYRITRDGGLLNSFPANAELPGFDPHALQQVVD